jgi:hypothetical protein
MSAFSLVADGLLARTRLQTVNRLCVCGGVCSNGAAYPCICGRKRGRDGVDQRPGRANVIDEAKRIPSFAHQ